MRVCIVGAGAAGLAAVHQAINYNVQCVAFEQNDKIGGTWIYDPRTGSDEYGLPIHTSMYKNLRTNLPKEVMGFPDYQIREDENSYITQQQILDFLESYTDHFKLRPHLKLSHYVKNIKPTTDDKWLVSVRDLKSSKEWVETFDGVMVCNGHYHTPRVLHLAGSDIFQGRIMHSHDYREPGPFRDRCVVVIGAGPSGMDIALQIAAAGAQTVYLSHHCPPGEITTIFPDNLQEKPDVDHLTETEAVFKDESHVKIDCVIYCTGFLYNFPFLDERCAIKVNENHVQPLYKHLVNINYPSMCFVGLPFYVCAFSMFDLQCRFYMSYMMGRTSLPTREEMAREVSEYKQKLNSEGLGDRHAHMMGPKQECYYRELSDMAALTPLPPVLTKLHNESSQRFNKDLLHFRNDVYQIINDDHFVQIK